MRESVRPSEFNCCPISAIADEWLYSLPCLSEWKGGHVERETASDDSAASLIALLRGRFGNPARDAMG
jgi:hypothetical protein